MLQAPLFDGLPFDPFALFDDGLGPAEVGIGGCGVAKGGSGATTLSGYLNPVENVWQFMRDNWLSNRIFKSYDDVVDHCCFAWNKLADQPWRIMTLGLRTWAHRY